ncbi:hypothetical protein BC834DRAFT_25014 [Gloeopeniophorella convolvens]|nr:hypothetical protein BC834DRAFT_25014 [Gloeopeniophorella convolvens]
MKRAFIPGELVKVTHNFQGVIFARKRVGMIRLLLVLSLFSYSSDRAIGPRARDLRGASQNEPLACDIMQCIMGCAARLTTTASEHPILSCPFLLSHHPAVLQIFEYYIGVLYMWWPCNPSDVAAHYSTVGMDRWNKVPHMRVFTLRRSRGRVSRDAIGITNTEGREVPSTEPPVPVGLQYRSVASCHSSKTHCNEVSIHQLSSAYFNQHRDSHGC